MYARHLIEIIYPLACSDDTACSDGSATAADILLFAYLLPLPPGVNLHSVAVQAQQHLHTSICKKRGGAGCCCKYLRQTRLFQRGEHHRRGDLRLCDFHLTEHRAGEERVVPYNIDILLARGANMDLQLVGSQHRITTRNQCLCGGLHDKSCDKLQKAIQDTLQQLPPTSTAMQG